MKQTLLAGLTLFLSLLSAAQPVITQNPVDATICPGSCDEFTVSAVGNGLTFQWFADEGLGLQGIATGDTLELCADDFTADTVMLLCIVTDSSGMTDTSNMAIANLDPCTPPIANFGFVVFGDSVCFTDSSIRADNVLYNYGNGGQSTDRNPCYDFMDYQLFFVRLYAYNAYGSDEIEKEVSTLSVGELNSLEAEIYPIPASDFLIIQSDERIQQAQLYDLAGSVMMTALGSNSNAMQLDIQQLPSGTYLLKVEGEKGMAFRPIIVH